MRIISGTAKGRKLAGFKGDSIRPTSDRVREAVFSSLMSQFGHFQGIKVLDLFAGTGAMAIEALSRGAASALLVDHSREAGNLIASNLATTRLTDKARFQSGKVAFVLPRINNNGPFNLIFLDPPYAEAEVEEIVKSVIHCGLLQSDGIICVETSSKLHLPDLIGSLVCSSRRQYGSTAVSFYHYADSGDDIQ